MQTRSNEVMTLLPWTLPLPPSRSKPFFLTTFSSGLFSIYLLGFLLIPSWREDFRLSLKILATRRRLASSRRGDDDETADSGQDDGEQEVLPLLEEDTFLVSPALKHCAIPNP